MHDFTFRSINPNRRPRIIGVGFCKEEAPLDRMVGWEPGTWGYHGDDGELYEERSWGGRTYGKKFGAKDVIGCGVNFEDGTAGFTWNGEYLGEFVDLHVGRRVLVPDSPWYRCRLFRAERQTLSSGEF
jgi:hypothetical protein